MNSPKVNETSEIRILTASLHIQKRDEISQDGISIFFWRQMFLFLNDTIEYLQIYSRYH